MPAAPPPRTPSLVTSRYSHRTLARRRRRALAFSLSRSRALAASLQFAASTRAASAPTEPARAPAAAHLPPHRSIPLIAEHFRTACSSSSLSTTTPLVSPLAAPHGHSPSVYRWLSRRRRPICEYGGGARRGKRFAGRGARSGRALQAQNSRRCGCLCCAQQRRPSGLRHRKDQHTQVQAGLAQPHAAWLARRAARGAPRRRVPPVADERLDTSSGASRCPDWSRGARRSMNAPDSCSSGTHATSRRLASTRPLREGLATTGLRQSAVGSSRSTPTWPAGACARLCTPYRKRRRG